MAINQRQIVRPVAREDRTQLANLLHFSPYVHRHLDWRSPLDWVGHPPYYALESQDRVIASLACSPDTPKITWIRVFVCDTPITPLLAWKALWPEISRELLDLGIEALAAIPIQKWFRELLEQNDFFRLHNIITLAWDHPGSDLSISEEHPNIRQMTEADLKQIHQIDTAAFAPLWQHSTELIRLAFSQANYASVFQQDGEILGYQISTPTRYGAHLGRLAVHPSSQRMGVGFALLRNLLARFSDNQQIRISVNTHDTNQASLALYHKVGFAKTSESYPVYQYNL